MTPTEEAAVLDITREEADAAFDARARKYLDMSGAELVAAVARGDELPDHPMVAHLLLMIGAPAGEE